MEIPYQIHQLKHSIYHIIQVLCNKWNVSSDGLIWNFYIRENVLWHNSTRFTADDIKYTFDVIKNKNLSSVYKKKS